MNKEQLNKDLVGLMVLQKQLAKPPKQCMIL